MVSSNGVCPFFYALARLVPATKELGANTAMKTLLGRGKADFVSLTEHRTGVRDGLHQYCVHDAR